jgi:hypothetical protein
MMDAASTGAVAAEMKTAKPLRQREASGSSTVTKSGLTCGGDNKSGHLTVNGSDSEAVQGSRRSYSNE